MFRIYAIFIGFVVVSYGELAAQDRPYFVAPVTSPLQRDHTHAQADAYALVDIDTIEVEGKKPNTKALLEAGFQTALANLPKKNYLYLMTHSHLGTAEKENTQAIKRALKEIAQDAGFQNVAVYESSTSATWRERVEPAEQYLEGEVTDETVVENDYVRVFPIRTKLSKLLAGDGDCIVEIFRPIDGSFTELGGPLRAAIVEAVRAVKLEQKKMLIFALSSTNKGSEIIERVFASRDRPVLLDANDPFFVNQFQEAMKRFVPSPSLQLAEELGFRSCRYRHSPGGGAPEELLGKDIPNFQLPDLKGNEFDLLRDTQGIPKVIVFWGLACGPCRIEAPHLSKLQESMGTDKLRIVAVNAYKDKREDVAKYVEQDNLAHTFVLNGEKLAEDEYKVSSYPTTFFVDSHGKVVAYEVGFFSEARLQKLVQKLLLTE